jgi:hypothetical protein
VKRAAWLPVLLWLVWSAEAAAQNFPTAPLPWTMPWRMMACSNGTP